MTVASFPMSRYSDATVTLHDPHQKAEFRGIPRNSKFAPDVSPALHPGQILAAALWLADQPRNPASVIQILQDRFGLAHEEAHDAVVVAGRMQMLRRAFA